MRVQTTDPMNGQDVTDIAHAPFIIEGSGNDALKIFFGSEENRRAYLEIETRRLVDHNVAIYNQTTGTAREM